MKKLELIQTPVARAEMLIRRPVAEVFEAFINPEITTKFETVAKLQSIVTPFRGVVDGG